jgi:hypothetical protein
VLSAAHISAQQATSNLADPSSSPAGHASLRICLRLADESSFGGPARVRLRNAEGREVPGMPEPDGNFLFNDVAARAYTIEATAPGFAPVHQKIEIEDHRSLTRFVVMNPKSVHPAQPPSPLPEAELPPPAIVSWLPPGIDEKVPYVDPDEPCPLDEITAGTGKRMTEFVSNLEKFTASERVEHYPVDILGARRDPQIRNFNYVVTVSRTAKGVFLLDEFRNGSADPEQFPSHIATTGMPAIALLFHPLLAPDFKFSCEGLGDWEGNAAWQVHFEQRSDQPGRLLAYAADGKYSSLALKGRAWIDPGTLQVLRLESELVKPPVDLGLTVEDVAISYHPVHFRSLDGQLWLPKLIDVYVERKGRRYYRRHTLSDFQLFTVEATQNIKFAKESYRFTNETDRDIKGVLTVTPIPGSKAAPVSLSFTIPAGESVLKLVGHGKDIQMPAESIGSATFTHEGPHDAVRVDAHLSKESTLDVISGPTH